MSLSADADLIASGARGTAATPARPAVPAIGLDMRRLELAEWDGVAAGFDGVVQEQLFAYAGTRWPGAAPEALQFTLNGEIVGGALVMVQKLPLRTGAIALCKWGPMLRRAARPDAPALYAAMIEALIAEYAGRRKMMLSVLPRAVTGPENWQYAQLATRGFRHGAVLPFPDRYIVSLRLDDAAQKQSFAQKWRYHLNKALKAGLEFERGGRERLGEFDALYQAMTDRKRFPDHSAYGTLAALLESPVPSLRPELFFVRHKAEIVAGAAIFAAGDTAVYLFGATNDEALPLRAGYFLHWEIIRWLRDNTAAQWYDLGGTDGFLGLHQFKKGMVGTAGSISEVPPVANFATAPLAMLIGTAAFAGREFAHALQRQYERLRGDKARPDQQRPAAGNE